MFTDGDGGEDFQEIVWLSGSVFVLFLAAGLILNKLLLYSEFLSL